MRPKITNLLFNCLTTNYMSHLTFSISLKVSYYLRIRTKKKLKRARENGRKIQNVCTQAKVMLLSSQVQEVS